MERSLGYDEDASEEQHPAMQEMLELPSEEENQSVNNKLISWEDSEFILFYRVCKIFTSRHKQMKLVKLKNYMTRWVFACSQLRFIQEEKITPEYLAHRSDLMSALAVQSNLEEMLNAENDEYNAKVYELTHIGGASMLITFWRCRTIRILSVAFQRWLLGVAHLESLRKLAGMSNQLRVDTKELSDRQAKSKDVDETNSRLQLSLLVVLSVLRLRTHSFLLSLYTARVRDAKVRKQLFSDVVLVKEALKRYMVQDTVGSTTALEHGKECNSSLQSVQDNILVAVEVHKKLKLASDEINRMQRNVRNTKVLLDRKSGVSSNGGVVSGTGTGIRIKKDQKASDEISHDTN